MRLWAFTLVLSWFINDISAVEFLYPWSGRDHRTQTEVNIAYEGDVNSKSWFRHDLERQHKTAEDSWKPVKVETKYFTNTSLKCLQSTKLFSNSNFLFPTAGQGLLFNGVARSRSDTPQSVGLIWTSDQPSQRPLRDNTQHTRQTYMHPAGFEPAIPISE